jgi:hypothetical protein
MKTRPAFLPERQAERAHEVHRERKVEDIRYQPAGDLPGLETPPSEGEMVFVRVLLEARDDHPQRDGSRGGGEEREHEQDRTREFPEGGEGRGAPPPPDAGTHGHDRQEEEDERDRAEQPARGQAEENGAEGVDAEEEPDPPLLGETARGVPDESGGSGPHPGEDLGKQGREEERRKDPGYRRHPPTSPAW